MSSASPSKQSESKESRNSDREKFDASAKRIYYNVVYSAVFILNFDLIQRLNMIQ